MAKGAIRLKRATGPTYEMGVCGAQEKHALGQSHGGGGTGRIRACVKAVG